MSEASERGQRYRDRAKEVLIEDDTLRYMRSFGGKLAIAADRIEEQKAQLGAVQTVLNKRAFILHTGKQKAVYVEDVQRALNGDDDG